METFNVWFSNKKTFCAKLAVKQNNMNVNILNSL